MRYKFRYRRGFFWKSIEVTGHRYEKEQDKMVLFFKNGGVEEIKGWRHCECKLGSDWHSETVREMERKAGQKLPIDPGG